MGKTLTRSYSSCSIRMKQKNNGPLIYIAPVIMR